MVKKRKHSKAEIAAKLAQADALGREGRLQSDIARALGVSVMTLHRWRKAAPDVEVIAAPSREIGEPALDSDQKNRIADLQLENSRLRKLVTDLLLEKMKLEEAAQNSTTRRVSR